MDAHSDLPDPSRLLSDPELRLRYTRDLLSDVASENRRDRLEKLATLLLWLEVTARLSALGDTSDSFGLARFDYQTHEDTGIGAFTPTDRGEQGAERRHEGEGPGADNGTSDTRLWVEFVRTRFIGLSATGAPLPDASSPLSLPESSRSAINQALCDLENSTLPVEVYTRIADLLFAELSSSRPPSPAFRADTSALRPVSMKTRERVMYAFEAAAASPPVQRQLVSTLLSHHVSPAFSDSTSHESALLVEIWPECSEDGPRISPVLSSPSRLGSNAVFPASRFEPDRHDFDDEDVKSLRTGIREARAAITRTDDKLRWLLGANYQPGCQQTTIESTSSSKRKRRVVPTPLVTTLQDASVKTASIASPTLPSASISSATSSRFGLAHFRNPSTTSSTMPLLRHQRSVSTGRQSSSGGSGAAKSRIDRDDIPHRLPSATTRPQAGLHRKRSLSTGQLPDGFHAPSNTQTWWSEARQGLPPPLGTGISDIATRPPPSATIGTSEKPFGNLAPAFVLSFDASCSVSSREADAFSRNTLTEKQRRELVRRSKKLEGFFGVPFQEEAAQRVLVNSCTADDNASRPPGRAAGDTRTPVAPTSSRGSSSVNVVEPISPRSFSPHPGAELSRPSDSRPSLPERPSFGTRNQLAAPLMRRSSSSPFHRSPSFSSSIGSGARSQSSSPPRRLSVFERETQARERDERRKKLEKVRRFLGERVPADLVVACEAIDSGGAVQEQSRRGHGKSSSVHWRRGRKKMLGSGGSGGAMTTAAGPAGPIPGSWRFAQPGDFAPFGEPPRPIPSQQEASGVAALSKARKLENLFGELPPTSLYRPNGSVGAPVKPVLSHKRSISDITTIYSPFLPNAQAGQWGQADAHRWQSARSHSRTADPYRQSIASLSYIAEQDPAAFDEVMRVYASSPGSEGDQVGTSGDSSVQPALDAISQHGEDEEDCPSTEAATMTRSLSAQSVRAVKQAQKLSQILGTTKGEVWQLLLGDLEAAILDDDSLEEEARCEVLQKLEQLRRSKSFARPRSS